ncbi:MAG TPA: hypothetical protein VGH03_01090 [Caulobacteraceae bacterium]|jgi:hypothetical protein
MTYSIVDAEIYAWAERHGLKVCTEFAGAPRRFCYVSGGEHECFQVSIEPPEDGAVTVNAWDVETQDDAELHRQWRVALGDLDPTLEAALRQIVDWKSRPRIRGWGEKP